VLLRQLIDWIILNEQRLPGQPDAYPAVDFPVGVTRSSGTDHRDRVFLGLRQPGNDLLLVCADPPGGRFEYDIGADDNLAVRVSRSVLTRFSGDFDQFIGLLKTGAVYRQHGSQIA